MGPQGRPELKGPRAYLGTKERLETPASLDHQDRLGFPENRVHRGRREGTDDQEPPDRMDLKETRAMTDFPDHRDHLD